MTTTQSLAERLEELRDEYRAKLVETPFNVSAAYEIRIRLLTTMEREIDTILSALRSRDSVIEDCARIADSYSRGEDNFAECACRIRELAQAPAPEGPKIVSARLIPWEPGMQGVDLTLSDGLRVALPLTAALSSHAETAESFDLIAYLGRQWPWSKKTFGPGDRTAGVLDHIRKELTEIEADPDDLSEWADVVILAMDGVWRRGFTAEQFCAALQAKQNKNFARQWPDWRTQPTDKAIEHVRTESPAMIKAAKGGEM